MGWMLLWAALVGPLPVFSNRPPDPLNTSLKEILEAAAQESKYLYLAFLGKNWSMTSRNFTKRVLEDPAFVDFAAGRLVYCPVNAQIKPHLNNAEIARLQSLVIYFDIKTYPTVIILAPNGQEMIRHGYREETATAYLELLDPLLPKLPDH